MIVAITQRIKYIEQHLVVKSSLCDMFANQRAYVGQEFFEVCNISIQKKVHFFILEFSSVSAKKMAAFEVKQEAPLVQPQCTNFIMATSHEEMNPRRRNTMEDVHRVIPSLKGSPDYSYFGVYDGHGGRQIADFLEETLENNISIELQHDDDATILERLQRAYLITDMQSRRLNIVTSGATAVSGLMHTVSADATTGVPSRHMYVANVGDSRAVIMINRSQPLPNLQPDDIGTSCTYLAYRLTYDHRADDSQEQARIQAAGGFITRARVLGILAVSRSFGDHGMKDFVTADPFVTEINLTGIDAPFFIMACDGVWDVFSDQEACELILTEYEKNDNKPFEAAAEMLVTAAVERGSADNVTAIVTFL